MPKEIEKTEKKETEKKKTKPKIKKEIEKKKQETKPKIPKTLKKDKVNKDKEKKEEPKIEKSEEKKEELKDKKPVISEKIEKRKEKKERIGVLNIYTTFNNTLMNLTDLSGRSIAKFGGGQSTKQDRLKANPTIAMFVSQRIAEEARDNGITGFYVKIRAKTGQNNPGPGAHAAIKSLTRAGFRILSIMDTTRVPRGGPKKKGGRRGRRP